MKKPTRNNRDKAVSNKRSKRSPKKADEDVVPKKEEETDTAVVLQEEETPKSSEVSVSDSNDNNDKSKLNNKSNEVTDEMQQSDDEEEEESSSKAEMDDAEASKKAFVQATTSNISSKKTSDGRYRNKQRCLVLSSRGVTARYRHLLEDLRKLMPHHKKDYKLDPTKSGGVSQSLTEICEVMSCNSYLYMECRKRMDAYLWIGLAPHGPSARFYIWNVHTMDELRLTGNCMKGGRPVLSFDDSFDTIPHLKLLKTLFNAVFGTPRGHPKSKPFVDRVMGFYYADQKIWVRNYQIVEEVASINADEATATKPATTDPSTSLVEIGPRFVLNPMKIFSGSVRGQVLYQNTSFVSPNEIRAKEKRYQGLEYDSRKDWEEKRKERDDNLVIVDDPLSSVFR